MASSRLQALLAMVEEIWQKFGAFVHQQLIWAKDRPILTRSWFSWQHEPCFFGWVRPRKPPRHAEDYPSSILNVPTIRSGQASEHPTSKPLELFRIPLRRHTRAGELCYEPFAGSGSQIIAAEQLGRRCNAIEITRATRVEATACTRRLCTTPVAATSVTDEASARSARFTKSNSKKR